MSHTGRAVYNAMYEPWNLTPAQRAFAGPGDDDSIDDSKPVACPSDAPTEREWQERLESTTFGAVEYIICTGLKN